MAAEKSHLGTLASDSARASAVRPPFLTEIETDAELKQKNALRVRVISVHSYD